MWSNGRFQPIRHSTRSCDKTGSLTSIKRHDYLPFGEELFTGTGNRTAAMGYSADSGSVKDFV